MPLLPATAVVNSAQVLQTQSGTTVQGTSSVFSKLQVGTGTQYGANSAQLLSHQGPAAPSSVSSTAPASPDALKPKLDYARRSLSELNARAAAIKPTNATESLQNHLDALNAQFRALGKNLEQSAAKNDPMQLLRLQNDIYQLDEELELVSKVVDQTTSGVRSLLQTQV